MWMFGLILTAPIHCRVSIDKQMIAYNDNLMNKQKYLGYL